MRSLALKLTLAFLLVGLSGALLITVLLQVRTRSAFDQFILNQEQQTLVNQLTQYFQEHNSWQGVEQSFQSNLLSQDRPDNKRDPTRFTLVGADHNVVFGSPRDRQRQPISDSELNRSIPLKVNNITVGWLLQGQSPVPFGVNTPESIFIENINQAALLSGLVAVVLALILGSVLALTLTRSLRELTEATVDIARGKLGRQVKIRSRDEVGELATSFNKMSLDLERATQARRQMTADIAHDLRTPLSVLTGYAEALADGKLPGTPEIYTIFHEETLHLNKLVEDLRTLSLADVGELPLNREPTPPQVILERVVARHTFNAAHKDIQLVALPATSLPPVLVDAERMNQVLDNIVANAFRYTPRGGKIELSAAGAPTGVQLMVRDTGSGIRAEDLPHIFDRFYRGDAARRQTGESGLGLAIVKSIVEAHGGSITVQSTPEQGTLFTITLPIA